MLIVKTLNKATGEIKELEIKSAEMAKDALVEFNASISAQKKAVEQIKGYLDNYLGNSDEHRFADGKLLKRKQRETVSWTIDALHTIGVDDDAIAVVSKISMPEARKLIDEMIEKGEIKPDSKKYLNESADRSFSAPYLELR